MTHRRSPYKLRADGQPKGLVLTRATWAHWRLLAEAMGDLDRIERAPSPVSIVSCAERDRRADGARVEWVPATDHIRLASDFPGYGDDLRPPGGKQL